MKYFVFSDVHGFYDEFINSLKEAGFDENNKDHKLISLGDNFDRGNGNYKMFEFLKEMKKKNKIILLKGNHEDLIIKMIFRKKPFGHDFTNGTYETINEFSVKYFGENDMFFKGYDNLYMALKEDGFFDLIYEMKDYYETDNYIFTHGYIPVKCKMFTNEFSYNENWRNESKEEFEASRWYNGMELAEYYKIYEKDKKIVVGHWHAAYGNVRKKYGFNQNSRLLDNYQFSELDFCKPYEGKHVIGIDACTVRSKMVNVVVIED